MLIFSGDLLRVLCASERTGGGGAGASVSLCAVPYSKATSEFRLNSVLGARRRRLTDSLIFEASAVYNLPTGI
jgi:hypothetical protein